MYARARVFMYSHLRGGVDEIAKNWEGIKHGMREDLHIAMAHAPHEIKEENVSIDQAHGPKPH